MFIHEFNYSNLDARIKIYTSGLNLPLKDVEHSFIAWDGVSNQRQMFSAKIVDCKVVGGLYTPPIGPYAEKPKRTNVIPDFVTVHMQSALNNAKSQLGNNVVYVDGLSERYINQLWDLCT